MEIFEGGWGGWEEGGGVEGWRGGDGCKAGESIGSDRRTIAG